MTNWLSRATEVLLQSVSIPQNPPEQLGPNMIDNSKIVSKVETLNVVRLTREDTLDMIQQYLNSKGIALEPESFEEISALTLSGKENYNLVIYCKGAEMELK